MNQKSCEYDQGKRYGPYFAAANSGRGFVSFYEEIFGRAGLSARYIIKGGPGTGKSSFMKKAAEYALARGHHVEYYRCSSDPDSLDGIVIDGRVAMLDGTAPHSEDAKLPGARDELIHLGAFWDSDALTASYERIAALDAQKGAAYRKAYHFLSACFEIDEVNRQLLTPVIKQAKLRRAVARLCEDIPTGNGFSAAPRLVDSVGMKGVVRLESFEAEAKTLYWLEDEYGTASFFLAALADEAQKKQCAIEVARDPICPAMLNALRFCESGLCFVAGNPKQKPMPDGAIRINLKRFSDGAALSQVKAELRKNKRLRAAILDAACEALAEAGSYHFELEKIYVSCMDFEAQTRFLTSFCENVLRKQLNR